MNKKASARNVTGKIGVYLLAGSKKIIAEIGIAGKSKYLGRFTHVDDARSKNIISENLREVQND